MINGKLGKMGAAALRKTIEDIVGLNLSYIRYLVYVLLRACLKIAGMNFQTRSGAAAPELCCLRRDTGRQAYVHRNCRIACFFHKSFIEFISFFMISSLSCDKIPLSIRKIQKKNIFLEVIL